MYYQGEAEKKERRKIIAVATAAVVLILILIVAIIVVATKKSAKSNISDAQNSAFELSESDDKKTETEKTEDKKDESQNNVGNLSNNATVANNNDVPAVVAGADIPSTGPEDVLPVALILGALVAYGSSAILAKREA